MLKDMIKQKESVNYCLKIEIMKNKWTRSQIKNNVKLE